MLRQSFLEYKKIKTPLLRQNIFDFIFMGYLEEEIVQQKRIGWCEQLIYFCYRRFRTTLMSYRMTTSGLRERVAILNECSENCAKHIYGHVYHIVYLGKGRKLKLDVPISTSKS